MTTEYAQNLVSKSNTYNQSNLFQSFGSSSECKNDDTQLGYSHKNALYNASELLSNELFYLDYVSPFSPYIEFSKSASTDS